MTTESAVSAARRIASSHAPLLGVLAVGIGLRGYLFFVYRPVIAEFNDSTVYMAASHDHLFGDHSRMAGYSLFLRVLHAIDGDLRFVVAVQHLLGLATGVLLYACVYRVTDRRWLSILPAAFFLFSIDYLVLEHSLLSETLYIFLVTLALFGLVFALTDRQTGRWAHSHVALAASGVALGCAWSARTAITLAILFIVPWLFATFGPDVRSRLAASGVFAAGAAGTVATYVIVQGVLTGFWGTVPASGWILYARVAPIADCKQFDPPAGTRFLCESSPIASRAGPEYYQSVGGPARSRFGDPFASNGVGSSVVGRFARSVVLHEPLTYLQEVGRDLARYITPSAGLDRPFSGAGPEELDLTRRSPQTERWTLQASRRFGFGGGRIHVGPGMSFLGDVQSSLRIGGIALVALLGLALAGLAIGAPVVRATAVLLFGTAILQPLFAVATLSWGWRYGVVGTGELLAAAALGIHALVARFASTPVGAADSLAGRRAAAQIESPKPTSIRSRTRRIGTRRS